MLERLFNTHQIADLLGTNEAAVNDWIKRGWLPVRDSPGQQVRISEKGLVQFLKNRGIDLEAIITNVAPDDPQEPLPETVSPEEPLAPRPFDGAQGRRQGREQGRTAAHPAEPISPPSEESPRTERPQVAPAPQTDRVPPDEVVEEVEHLESHQADPAAQVADALLRNAAVKRVSHIHLDSFRDELSLRVRIDGLLHDKPNFKSRLPKGLGPRLVAHLKNLAGLEVGEVAHPKTGSFHFDINGVQEDFRLATHPTLHGERLVIHVPARGQDAPTLDGIGLGENDLSSLRAMLAEPCGLILVAGLPGSGPATTLRAMLAEVDT
ncbi:MAG: Flp pilus assembly complex ATPase component TadA, partial [Phycisphaerae bacterium]|nr:Flp pilus assembly complex ATPase component TadA [Phycisphaerae bacterium]